MFTDCKSLFSFELSLKFSQKFSYNGRFHSLETKDSLVCLKLSSEGILFSSEEKNFSSEESFFSSKEKLDGNKENSFYQLESK